MEIQGSEEDIDSVILMIEQGRYVQIENMITEELPAEVGGILIEIQEGMPSEKHIFLAIKVIEELDDCVRKAQAWLEHFKW